MSPERPPSPIPASPFNEALMRISQTYAAQARLSQLVAGDKFGITMGGDTDVLLPPHFQEVFFRHVYSAFQEQLDRDFKILSEQIDWHTNATKSPSSLRDAYAVDYPDQRQATVGEALYRGGR